MNAWELIIQQPVTNILIVMSHYLANSFGLAIIALTVIVNVLMLPFTLKQMRASKAMQDLQPKLAEIKKKYEKDREKLAKEQMNLYKESGMSPVGCLLPMLIQMPIWIALYQAIMLSLAVAPEGLLNLSRYLYSWHIVYSIVPLSNGFLWLDLSAPDPFLAVLVGITMWVQQKMATTNVSQQSQLTLWMMPIMFGFLAFSFPSGLSLFWVASSLVRIIMQYYVTGWGGLVSTAAGKPESSKDKKYLRLISNAERKSTDDLEADIVVKSDEEKQKRDRGLGYPSNPSKIRYQPGQDRKQQPKKK